MWARLEAGRPYAKEKTGELPWRYAAGSGAPNLARRRAPNRIPGEEQLYIFPSGWRGAECWHRVQVDNILRLLDRLKRRYNVDESRVYLTGISDGGTGTYFMAMRESTPVVVVPALNGSILVLGNPNVHADGELYANNLVNSEGIPAVRTFFVAVAREAGL